MLKDADGKICYSGMFGGKQTQATVEKRHSRNRDRFSPANGDTIVVEPDKRTYGESRLLGQRLSEKHGTYIGRDGDNYRGNRQNPLVEDKLPEYEGYEKRLKQIAGEACP